MSAARLCKRGQRGAALIAVIFFIVVMSLLAAVTAYLVASDSAGASDYGASEQAFAVAQGGLEQAILQYKTGTACAALTNTNIPLGNGSYTTSGTVHATTTTLAAALAAGDTVIRVNSLVGFGTHGRVSINSEEINYSDTSTDPVVCLGAAACLTGARRAQNNTTVAAAAAAAVVRQNICQIRSVGTVLTAQRTVEASMVPARAAFLDGANVAVGTTATVLGTLNTVLPAGDNIVLAKVAFRNTNANRQIAAGNLQLLRNGTAVASNQFIIDVGGYPPSNNNFPQETQYLLFRDANAPANASYSATAAATNTNINAELKLIVLNGFEPNTFQDGGGVAMGTTTTTLITHNSTVPAGNNAVLAVVQMDNTAGGGPRTILAGNLRLARGATVLSTNQFNLSLARQSRVNQGTAMLLLGLDAGAPANPSYTVTGLASNTGVNAEVKIVVFSGITSALFDGNSIAIGTTATTTGTLATMFPAGENIVIASTQYENTAGGLRIIAAGGEELMYGGVAQASSAFDIDLCSGTVECNDFDKGLMWRHAASPPSPSYAIRARANNTGISGETKILALHIDNPAVDWQEIFP